MDNNTLFGTTSPSTVTHVFLLPGKNKNAEIYTKLDAKRSQN